MPLLQSSTCRDIEYHGSWHEFSHAKRSQECCKEEPDTLRDWMSLI
jgi:hypothetical protein